MQPTSPNSKAYLALTITTWGWGTNAIFSKLAVGHISPVQLVTARWLGASLLLIFFAHRQIRNEWPVIRQHFRYFGIMGAVGFTGFSTLLFLSAHTTSAINIGILQGSIPIFVLLGSFLLFRFKVTPLQAMGVLITLFGVIIVTSGGSLQVLRTLRFNVGDLYMLLACLFYASYSIGLSRRPAGSALVLLTALSIAALLSSLPLLAIETYMQGFTPPTPKGWLIALLVTLLPSFVSQLLFINAVALIGPERAGVFINLVPVFASFMAVFFLHEPLQWFQGAGLIMVLGGIGLSELGKRGSLPRPPG